MARTAPAPENIGAAPTSTAPATLIVHVVAAEDGAPIAGAAVLFVEDTPQKPRVERCAKADSEGIARIETVAPFVSTRASAPDRVPSGFDLWSRDAESKSEITIKLDGGALLAGVVVDVRDGRPVAGARVVVVNGGMEGLGSRWTTDGSWPFADVVVGGDGRFAVRVPQNQTVTATAAADRFSDDGRTIRVGVSETPIELRLAPGGRLRGIVHDPDGGTVADAWVYAIPAHMPELLDLPEGWVDRGGRRWTALVAQTHADGRYEMTGLSRGAVYIAFAKAGSWARSERREGVFVSDADPEGVADFSMRRCGSLVVHVVDADGAPVRASVDLAAGEGQSEDDIHIQWSDPQDIQDDATRFRRLVPGAYWASSGQTAALREGPRTSVVITAGQTTEVTLRQDRPVAIEGVVVDDHGEPVPTAMIYADDPARPFNSAGELTDDAGHFRISDLRAGPYEVRVGISGYAPQSPPRIEAPASNVRIVLRRCGWVRARFLAPAGEPPIGRQNVVFVRREASTPETTVQSTAADDWDGYQKWGITDDEGEWRGAFAPGSCRVRLIVEGRVPVVRTVDVPADKTIDLGDVVLGPGLDLVGRVEDRSGAPVADARVTSGRRWSPEFREDDSRADGGFRFSRMAPGPHMVRAVAPGFVEASVDADLAVGSAALVVQLARGGVLRVRVTDAAGVPVSGAIVEFRRAGAAPTSASNVAGTTDFRGSFETRIVAAKYHVTIRGRDGTADADVTDGGETIVNLTAR